MWNYGVNAAREVQAIMGVMDRQGGGGGGQQQQRRGGGGGGWQQCTERGAGNGCDGPTWMLVPAPLLACCHVLYFCIFFIFRIFVFCTYFARLRSTLWSHRNVPNQAPTFAFWISICQQVQKTKLSNENFTQYTHTLDGSVCALYEVNIARIANAVQCHNWLSDNKDCYEFRFSIVRIVISV